MTLYALAVLQLIGMESVVILLARLRFRPLDPDDVRTAVFVVIVWPVLPIVGLTAVFNHLRPKWERKWR